MPLAPSSLPRWAKGGDRDTWAHIPGLEMMYWMLQLIYEVDVGWRDREILGEDCGCHPIARVTTPCSRLTLYA